MNQYIFEQIQKKSIKKIQNPEALKKYIQQSLIQGIPITFFNWECPPRFLDNGAVNYLVDLNKIFAGKKIDKYTELPRVVEQSRKEIRILNFLNSLGIKYRFIKIIADSNAYYLTPGSLDKFSREKIIKVYLRFKEKINNRLRI